MSIKYTQLSESLRISQAVTGLWQIADMERDGRRLELTQLSTAMLPYVEAGLTSFDMADHYGSAEDIVGIYRKAHSQDKPVQLFTKWVPEPGPVSKTTVRTAVERSLKRMQSEQLDLLQFHTWTYSDPSWLDCLFYLQELKDEGLIANLGLTNFNAAHLGIVLNSGIDVISNQVCFSLLDTRAKNDMTEMCLKHDVKILAYGTVAGGLLTEKWLGQAEPKLEEGTWSQMKYKRFINEVGGWDLFQNLLVTLDNIAKQNQVSMATVASRYILDHTAVGAVIIGARLGASEHIQDTIKLFEFELDNAATASIDASIADLTMLPNDCGDEYRQEPFLTASGDLSHHLESFPKPYQAIESKNRQLVLSGTSWESIAGFCRATRIDNRIIISGTTSTHIDKVIGGNDAAAQTHFVIDKLEAALISLDSKLEHVVKTRIYVKNIDDWEDVARTHGNRFKNILPANTLVQANLVGDDYLVEIEAEAIIP